MKRATLITIAALLLILNGTIYSQTDTLSINNTKSKKGYLGIGGGFGTSGSEWGVKGALIIKKGFGIGFSLSSNILRSKDTPDDYYSDGARMFVPRNYLSLLSLDMIKEFSQPGKMEKIGIAAGISYVKYNIAQFEYNSGYDPERYLYDKSHSATRTVGLVLRFKADLILKETAGIEMEIFSNINNIHSVVGIAFYVNLGQMTEE